MPPPVRECGGDAAEELTAGDHLVARVGEQQPARRRLNADQAGDEGHENHHDHRPESQLTPGGAQNAGDRIRVLAGKHRAHVRHGEYQGKAHQHRGGAAHVDGHAHGLGNHATRVRGLFRDVTAGLESVIAEHRASAEARNAGR